MQIPYPIIYGGWLIYSFVGLVASIIWFPFWLLGRICLYIAGAWFLFLLITIAAIKDIGIMRRATKEWRLEQKSKIPKPGLVNLVEKIFEKTERNHNVVVEQYYLLKEL
ncbi:MAG: hypothetical protein A3H06_00920 [Candidatus Colwellbacteria bacterium RIFCSPLOWO2_12_FULL_44_13]|uniref:Uncharacterized protein n=3 Tax=Candidatus Colwelliibacteriota TaxID=1817904 RepID=A0A1G1Z3V2_9BACT|nr:MAG: hypothetical protein A3F24_02095 [Candidatus Colwellbacteria bacterium RIFCSPHIGHO2_12_FULL_44_17]OGY59331.1 MAG: hypothetical protein A3I31_02330 [Candidatus Colwellbacteria bacterium RIFCSPLOWO2_02_FULL_44_20b]OGY61023.1 MAG: hypothetical protein A3H06_00920 [Candidatus Colwellbacteria bacterium RIFCSPLOWO2_12_FULL_44_13]